MTPIDPIVSLLIGAFGAALLGLVGGLLGAAIQARREHAKWIRAERLNAYAEYLKVIEPRFDLGEDIGSTFNEQIVAYSRLRLIGSEVVSTAAREYEEARLRLRMLENSGDRYNTRHGNAIEAAEGRLKEARDRFFKIARSDLRAS